MAASFVMTVAEVNQEDGYVLLSSLAVEDVPVEIRWFYGTSGEVMDHVGESYLVTFEQLSETTSEGLAESA